MVAGLILFGKWQLTSYLAGLAKSRESAAADEASNPAKAPARKSIDFPKFEKETTPVQPVTAVAKNTSDKLPGAPIPVIFEEKSPPPKQAEVPVIAKTHEPVASIQAKKEEIPMMLDSVDAPSKKKLVRGLEQGGTSPIFPQGMPGISTAPAGGMLPAAAPMAALRAVQTAMAATAQTNGATLSDQNRVSASNAATAPVETPRPLEQAAMKAAQTAIGGAAPDATAGAGNRSPDRSPVILRDAPTAMVEKPRTVEEMAAMKAKQSAISATAQASSANVGDRSRVILRGSYIECILESQLISNIPGITACIVPTNVYSDNGTKLLIRKGSKLVGEYSATAKMGDSRFGVLWQRIKTPEGVVIDVDSGAADSVGAMGQTGAFDAHWAERLGTAFMFSIVADGISTVLKPRPTGTSTSTTAAGAVTTSTVQQSATVDAAQSFARSQIQAAMSIPPTFFKNRGDRVSVFVNRDLWFN